MRPPPEPSVGKRGPCAGPRTRTLRPRPGRLRRVNCRDAAQSPPIRGPVPRPHRRRARAHRSLYAAAGSAAPGPGPAQAQCHRRLGLQAEPASHVRTRNATDDYWHSRSARRHPSSESTVSGRARAELTESLVDGSLSFTQFTGTRNLSDSELPRPGPPAGGQWLTHM